MPLWTSTEVLPQPVPVVFAFLRSPANRTKLAPLSWSLQLVSGPELLERGSRMVLRGRRKGISQTSELEVTAFEQDCLLEEEQRRGPFRRWKQSFTFEAAPEGGTRLTEWIDWEKPGGMLGLLVSEAMIEEELRELETHRRSVLGRLLADAATPLAGEGRGGG
jgi:ligand-binding SRPBCC domain-containing protein